MTRTMTIGITSAAVATWLVAFAVLGGSERKQDQVDMLPYGIGFALVISALLFGLLGPWAMKPRPAPRSNRPAKIGFASSVLAALTVVAFWSGLPVILGGLGIALGMAGRERATEAGRGRGLALGAVIIGLLAAIVAVGITVIEKL